jgi:hypothetical protein
MVLSVLVVAADVHTVQVRGGFRCAMPLCPSLCGAYQLLVYNHIPDPSFIMGGWATAEFVVSIAHNLLISESFSDGSNRSFPPMLI